MKVNALRTRRAAILASAVIAATATPAYAGGGHDSSHSEFADAVAVTEVNSAAGDGCPIETADGLSLFIASARPGTFGGNDIWAADRDSLTSPWGEPRNLGAPINTSAADFCPTPVMGRWLFFVSERAGDGIRRTGCLHRAILVADRLVVSPSESR